jgi:hypothetical protein
MTLSLWSACLVAATAATGWSLPALAQMDEGPVTETTFGVGLPRDHATTLFRDDQYPVFPLKPGQEAYADIDGPRMKQDIINLAQIALDYRDEGHPQWWGRFPGTSGDVEGMKYMTDEFERLGMTVESVPIVIEGDWRPDSWTMSYTSSGGANIDLATAFPASGTKATGPEGLTAEAIWVGIGAEADFLGRDVTGKAVVIYSTFVPGGRSHSASDRAGLFNANTRAMEKGAAMIINVMAVPGNAQFQPEGGIRQIPQMTLSQDEGFALRDRLGAGETVTVTLHLIVPEPEDRNTAYTIATLPGMSEEEIMVLAHTDGYFQGATDNASGMASALEIARHYAALPIEQRPRTMKFISFPDHHHGNAPEGVESDYFQEHYNWDVVALKLTMEHPSETLLYMYNSNLTPSNQLSATRWNALGSVEFETMALETLTDFGVSVYGVEDGPKNGDLAPSFHIINHVIYHTSLDTPELAPTEGMVRSTRAFAAIIDQVNTMTIEELRGDTFPAEDGRGSVLGPILAAN